MFYMLDILVKGHRAGRNAPSICGMGQIYIWLRNSYANFNFDFLMLISN